MILISFILTLLKPLILLVILNSFIIYRLMESLEDYLNFYLIFLSNRLQRVVLPNEVSTYRAVTSEMSFKSGVKCRGSDK